MSKQEQRELKQKYHAEAMRYMANANDTLKKARKEHKTYIDDKYVKSACGIAYLAVLKAIDGYLLLKGVPKKRGRKSIEYYQSAISQIDKKLNSDLHAAYYTLHLDGYYEGITYAPTIHSGFEVAYDIIKRIEP